MDQRPAALFAAGAQQSHASGGAPPTASQEALLNLLLAGGLPGLAGALHIASVYPDTMVRRHSGWTLPHNSAGFPVSAGLQPKGSPYLALPASSYPAAQTSQHPSASAQQAQAHRNHPRRGSSQSPPRPGKTPTINTKHNIDDLARIIISETSIGNDTERASVGFTVLNRMRRNGTARVKDVWSGYSRNQPPRPWAIRLAAKILSLKARIIRNRSCAIWQPAGEGWFLKRDAQPLPNPLLALKRE